MNTKQIPMFRTDGSRVQLEELMGVILTNNLTWSVIEFDGVGVMPQQMTFAEFQKKVRELPCGFLMSWDELIRFSKLLEYTIDCLIVGVQTQSDINVDRLLDDDFHGCEVSLRAVDSTYWILSAADENILEDLVAVATWLRLLPCPMSTELRFCDP